MPLLGVLVLSLMPLDDLLAMVQLVFHGLLVVAGLPGLLMGIVHAWIPLSLRAKRDVGALSFFFLSSVSEVIYARTGDVDLALRHFSMVPAQFCLGFAIASWAFRPRRSPIAVATTWR